MSTDSNKEEFSFYSAVCSLDLKEMKRQRSELPTSPRQPHRNAAQSRTVMSPRFLWTASTLAESPWSWGPIGNDVMWRIRTERTSWVSIAVFQTPNWERKKKMFSGLAWSENQPGSLMIKQKLWSLGHSLPLLEIFRNDVIATWRQRQEREWDRSFFSVNFY